MFKHSLPSIEQFAAYLDGNLSESEMSQISQLAEHDDVLHQLLDASSVVDETISNYSDLQLPSEITDSVFELPEIDRNNSSSLVDELFDDLDNSIADEEEPPEIDIDISDDIDNDLFNIDI